ncbi:MAG TPA: GNAT family N-acetyltransferase [Trebonia sp.]|nr:GNAT family N-acetyltransferase [Trebonia sp.]
MSGADAGLGPISPALAERVEAETYADYEAAVPASARAAAGAGQFRIGGGVALAIPGDATGYWNRVLGLGFAELISARLLTQVTGFYRQRGIAEATLALAPSVLPPDWAELREEFSISAAPTATAKLACGIDAARARVAENRARLADGLRVGPVAAGQAREFAEAKSTAFYGGISKAIYQNEMAHWIIGRPGWQSFAVFDDTAIVAVGSLHVADNVGHLFGGATRPEFRGRGAQSALIAARVEAAWAAGCDWVVAEAAAGDNSSLRNQRRAGLRLRYGRQHWTWRDRPAAQPAGLARAID